MTVTQQQCEKAKTHERYIKKSGLSYILFFTDLKYMNNSIVLFKIDYELVLHWILWYLIILSRLIFENKMSLKQIFMGFGEKRCRRWLKNKPQTIILPKHASVHNKNKKIIKVVLLFFPGCIVITRTYMHTHALGFHFLWGPKDVMIFTIYCSNPNIK